MKLTRESIQPFLSTPYLYGDDCNVVFVNVALSDRIFYRIRLVLHPNNYLYFYLLNFTGNEWCHKIRWNRLKERSKIIDIELWNNSHGLSRIEKI